MSEYTPTTDDVALAYIHAVNGDTWVSGKARALQAEFDRWLKQVKAEAWDEGYNTPNYSDLDERYGRPEPRNPYREETE